jgi:hypothetical protein
MVSEGRIVGPRPEAARQLQDRACQMLRDGPPPLSAEQLDQFRYLITCRVDDLRDPRDVREGVATGAWLYLVLADFVLRSRGQWAQTAKWIPRGLTAFDPQLEVAFTRAFDDLFVRHDPTAVVAFTETVLAPFGGPLLDGYESQSPPSARLLKS